MRAIFSAQNTAQTLLALHFVQGVAAQTRAVFLEPVSQSSGNTTLDVDGGPVVQLARLAALEPHVLSVCFSLFRLSSCLSGLLMRSSEDGLV